NTYLLQQFFSPHSNRREAEWGGHRPKRTLFPKSAIQAAKEAAVELGKPDFIIDYRFSPEQLEQPGINYDDTIFLLNELAEYPIDYFHFSTNSWSRTSIIDTTDEELLIDKYLRDASDKLRKIPIMGAGGIFSKEDVRL